MSQTKAQLIGAVGVSTASNLTIYGGLIGVAATFTGNVSVGGTLTYEDVTNVDSVGFVTARSGIEVGESLISGIGATILPTGNAVFAGIVTATSFVGDGSGLTGAGSTVADDTTTDANFYPVFTQTTSGTITASKVSTSKLSFNPSTGTLTVNGGTVWNSNNDGSGSGLDADTLDGYNVGTSGGAIPLLNGSNTWSGTTQVYTAVNYFQSDKGGTSGTVDSPPLQAYATGSNAAFMSFHRATSYAVNFGLDSDNVLRIGGWSAPANRLQLDMSGNLTAAGNVTAYSDESLKDNIETISNALDKVIQLRGVEFDRNDKEGNPHEIGVIAQEIEKVVPEVVITDNSGVKSVAYGNLVGLLVEAIKEQQEQIKNQQEQINELRALLEDK
jgi:hypothetical protein